MTDLSSCRWKGVELNKVDIVHIEGEGFQWTPFPAHPPKHPSFSPLTIIVHKSVVLSQVKFDWKSERSFYCKIELYFPCSK